MQTIAKQLSLFGDVNNIDLISDFSIRKSNRAKRLSIKVFPRGQVEVVVPKRTSVSDIRKFIDSHRGWIEQTRQRFAADYPPEPFRLPDTVQLNGIRQQFEVLYQFNEGAKTVKFRVKDNSLLLTGKTNEEGLCVAALKRWLTVLARTEYAPILTSLSVETGHLFRKMHIRGQRTCWGSHSSAGTISLNYCLMFLDPAYLRYVMIHELCHARQMNHSKRFWRLVEKYEPNYRQLDKGLNNSWKNIPIWVGIY